MTRFKLFISYSSEDQNLIDFIESELIEHNLFQALIIARKRESLKPLSEKVIIGLTEAEIIIPVLTENSLNTQWINQEIGYATAIKRKISPIVDKKIINKLKGFIHNQIDIPYNYIASKENINDFKEAFKMLIKDLEVEYSLKTKNETSEFLNLLNKVEEVNERKDFEQKKQKLIESEEGFIAFNEEIIKISNEFNKNLKLLNDQGIDPEVETERNPISYSIGKVGYISKIEIHQQFVNTSVGSSLFLGRFKGNIDANHVYNNCELIADIKYQFYYNNDLKPIWKRLNGNEEITSEKIVENCFNWLMERILEKN